jgi:hypothetical protein
MRRFEWQMLPSQASPTDWDHRRRAWDLRKANVEGAPRIFDDKVLNRVKPDAELDELRRTVGNSKGGGRVGDGTKALPDDLKEFVAKFRKLRSEGPWKRSWRTWLNTLDKDVTIWCTDVERRVAGCAAGATSSENDRARKTFRDELERAKGILDRLSASKKPMPRPRFEDE